MPETSDAALLHALRGGDRDALNDLFDQHYDGAFAFAERFLGDPAAAADVVQESFLRVLRYGDSFAGESSFRTWLLRVVRNACLDLVSARDRERAATGRLPPSDPVAPPEVPDPRIPELRAAVEALPETRREVLILRRWHGLSYAEIGDVCGISEGAARVRAHRALKQLRRALAPTNSQEATSHE